jgi:hypothetical protein
MPEAKYSREEVAARGEAIFAQEIQGTLDSDNKGQYLVLNIETGAYEIDQDDLIATKRLLAKSPDAVVYGLRIGFPAAYRLGGFSKVNN